MEKVETILKFDFRKSNLLDHDIDTLFKLFCKAYKICFNMVCFKWDESSSFIPLSGDYYVLGILIEIKKYDWSEFLEMIINHEVTLQFGTEIKFDKGNYEPVSYSYELKYIRNVDHQSTITHLENLGLVTTKLSESFISTDPRVFCVIEEVEMRNKDCISNDERINVVWHEVDILGTPYGKEITKYISTLFHRTI